MSTYRTGNHWGVTIVREGDVVTQGRMEPDGPVQPHRRKGDQLVAVVVNGDQALAERICALLNRSEAGPRTVAVNLVASMPADSCTCVYRPNGGADPNCVVHQGRRARGPKPPPLGEGCICDGSGRTCPRHGVVL